MPRIFRGLLAIAWLLGCASAAHADDWEVVKLRGEVLQLIDGAWQPLERGDIVPDSRVLRTLSFGRAELTRGGETVTLGPNTQIQIYDEHRARPFTTVVQSFGSVAIEANVENVQHFAVQTPYLAAVVKGTRFVVTSGKAGASVKVERGHVAVTDYASHDHVLIAAGQSAKIDSDTADEMTVSGTGELPQVVKTGVAATAPALTPNGHSDKDSSSSNGNSGKGDSEDNKGKSDKGKSGTGASNSGKGSDDEESDDEESGSGKSGGDNSGNGNSGNGNSGNGNSGKGNSGSGNSGNGNSGNGNSGKGNSGKGSSDSSEDD